MKKQLWVFLAITAMTAFLFALPAYAAGKTVYVSDGGTGDGTSQGAPLGSLKDAFSALGQNGGEIVIVGKATLPKNPIGTSQNAFVEPEHTGKVTLRGADKDAVLLFSGTYQYHLSGETEIRDLTLSSGAYTSGIDIAARGYHLTMGEGLTMHSTGNVSGENGTKIYLYGGCRNGVERLGLLSRNNHLTVKSGTYWFIGGFNRNINAPSTGKATVEIGGDVYTRFFVAGSTGTSSFVSPSGADVFVIGDIRISQQLSLGNQNSVVESFDTNLILQDGTVTFTGSVTDYTVRQKLTTLDIYVNEASASATKTYAKLFAGYGDSEGTLDAFCTKELLGHTYENGVCTVCHMRKATAECTAHTFQISTEGTIVSHTCETCGFTAKTTTLTAAQNGIYTYKSGNLRVQILGERIVRIEESANGKFVDQNTLIVPDRGAFDGTAVVRDEDKDTVILSTKDFTVNIPKNAVSASEVLIFDKAEKQLYSFFDTAKNGFYASLPAPADTPNTFVLCDNGVLPPDGGLTYTGSTDASSGWRQSENTDIYVLLPLGDAEQLRSDFVALTGRTALSDIKTLGSWWSKWTKYSAEERLAIAERYRKLNIPLDVMIIDTEWKNTSANGNDGDGTGYTVNEELYPDMEKFLATAEAAGLLILFNDHTHQTSLTITTPEELKWQSAGILSLMKMGLDGWWYDRNWTYSIKSPYGDVLFSTIGQVLYYDTMQKYHTDTASDSPKRVLMLSNVDWIKHGHITGDPSVIGHRYGIQWTGDIYGDPLQLRREIENMVLGGAKGASPYMSSDLGGFWHNDTVSENSFIRWVQYGAFSPAFRIHSTLSAKNEQLPWSYGTDAQATIKGYLDMRYNLMPYYYSLARENYESGMPLARRLDFYYPQHEESQDNTQYLLGKDLLVAPFWSTHGDGRDAVPTEWLTTAGGEHGLDVRYYNFEKGAAQSTYYTGTPVYSGTVPNLDFYWYTGSPNDKVNKDYFAARFTGKITPAYDCYIGTLADDGARIYIDGKLWSNGYAASQLDPSFNTRESLKAGKTYEIAVEYYELSGKAILYLMCEPVAAKDHSVRTVFLPDGNWINLFSGERITGPKTVTVTADVATMPLFVREGAVLPASRVISPMEGADWEELSLNIYGLGEGSFTLYEDDGESEAYMDGGYRKSEVTVHPVSGNTWQIDLGAAVGKFATDYTTRKVTVRIHSDKAITSAAVDGKPASVTKIDRDASAMPFAETGASAISAVYVITAEVSLADGAKLLVTADGATEIRMTVGSTTGYVNGVAKTLDAAPLIRNSRTMLPVRFVAENLGATVLWDGATSTATLVTATVEMKITIGALTATVNGQSVPLDSPAFIESGRTYLPVRFVAETLGATVLWDGATATATITK